MRARGGTRTEFPALQKLGTPENMRIQSSPTDLKPDPTLRAWTLSTGLFSSVQGTSNGGGHVSGSVHIWEASRTVLMNLFPVLRKRLFAPRSPPLLLPGIYPQPLSISRRGYPELTPAMDGSESPPAQGHVMSCVVCFSSLRKAARFRVRDTL